MTDQNNQDSDGIDESGEPVSTVEMPIDRRGAIGVLVTTLGLAGLTGQVSAQNDIGTNSNPYRRLYVSEGVVFEGTTSSDGLPEGALHVRSDLV